MHTWLSRIQDLLRRARSNQDRNDEGFSFAQVIVTMVIVGILGGIGTFAAFQYIGQSRETVLEANIQTAAAAVQNTLALDPGLKSGHTFTSDGAPPAELISALSSASSGFTWNPPNTMKSGGGYGWEFDDADGQDVVRIQMILKATPNNTDNGDSSTSGAVNPSSDAGNGLDASAAPVVRWLVADGDAIRIQIKNADGAWACALIVLRPDWNDSMVAGTAVDATIAATAEGNLRGIWYDAGANLRGNAATSDTEEAFGRHNCSPATVADIAMYTTGLNPYGYAALSASGATGNDPLPLNGAMWNIPYGTATGPATDDYDGTRVDTPDNGTGVDILGRVLQRTVPAFDAQ